MITNAQYLVIKQQGLINRLPINKAVIALTVILLSACATTRVQPDYDTAFNFNQYKSYILPLNAPSPRAKTKNLFVHSTIAQEIENELAQKNYIKLDSDGKQDFIVNYQIIIETRQPTSHGSIGLGLGSFGGRTSIGVGIGIPLYSSKTYQEGSLLIQITDSKQNRVVWQAAGSQAISIDTDRDKTRQHIRETVKEILAEFPPEQKR